MNFGTTVDWIATSIADTHYQIRQFRQRIQGAFGYMSFDASTLPIRVVANVEKQIVESYFPTVVGTLVANPEVFLAWAEKLEEALAVLASAN